MMSVTCNTFDLLSQRALEARPTGGVISGANRRTFSPNGRRLVDRGCKRRGSGFRATGARPLLLIGAPSVDNYHEHIALLVRDGIGYLLLDERSLWKIVAIIVADHRDGLDFGDDESEEAPDAA